jgi:hypothetical protein
LLLNKLSKDLEVSTETSFFILHAELSESPPNSGTLPTVTGGRASFDQACEAVPFLLPPSVFGGLNVSSPYYYISLVQNYEKKHNAQCTIHNYFCTFAAKLEKIHKNERISTQVRM